MSTELYAKEIVFSPDAFVEPLGRVTVNSGNSTCTPWTRQITFSRKTDFLFVPSDQGVAIYSTQALLDGASTIQPGTASEEYKIWTPSEVQFISLSPSEDRVIFCLLNCHALVYKLCDLNADSVPLQKFAFGVSCRDVIWIDDRSLLYLTSEGRVLKASLDGVLQPWSEVSGVIAMDVRGKTQIFVPKSTPSRISIPGDRVVSLDSVFADSKQGSVIVNGVKLIDKETLVASVVDWDKTEQMRIQQTLVLIKWNAATSNVSIFTHDLDIPIIGHIEELDPVLTCPLSVVELRKRTGWLVSCSENLDQPHLLVMEDRSEFLEPEESFPWPLREDQDDNMLLGVAMDTSLSFRIRPDKQQEQTEPAVLIFALANDGNLVISALAAQFNEPESIMKKEEEASVSEETLSEGTKIIDKAEIQVEADTSEKAEIQDQKEIPVKNDNTEIGKIKVSVDDKNTEQVKIQAPEETLVKNDNTEIDKIKVPVDDKNTEQVEIQKETKVSETEVFTNSAIPATDCKLQPNPTFKSDDQTVPGPSSPHSPESSTASSSINEETNEVPITLHAVIQEFENTRLDHLQTFRQLSRLTETMKLVKLQTVDLFLKLRNEMEKLELDFVDPLINQQSTYFRQLQNKLIRSLQIMQSLKTVLVESNTGPRLVLDGEGTSQILLNERNNLTGHPHMASGDQDLQSWLNSTMSKQTPVINQKSPVLEFQLPHQQKLIRTVVQGISTPDQNRRVWKVLSENRTVNWKELRLVTEVPDLETGQSRSHVLIKRNTGELEWVSHESMEFSEEDSAEVIEGSDSEELEICSEEEIARIVQLQETAGNSKRELHVHELTAEEQRQEKFYSHVLQKSAKFNPTVHEMSIVSLKPQQSSVISKQQFLMNLGKEQESADQQISESANSAPQLKETGPVSQPTPVEVTGTNTTPGDSGVRSEPTRGGLFNQTRGNIFGAPSQVNFQSSPSPQPPLQFMNSSLFSVNKSSNAELFKMRK
eukprot:g4808.t1